MKRILVKFVCGGDAMMFAVTTVICDDHGHLFERPIDRPGSNQYLEAIGRMGKGIVQRVLALNGVAKVRIEPYKILVTKGEAFDWSWQDHDIKALVLQILNTYLGDGYEVDDQTLPKNTEETTA